MIFYLLIYFLIYAIIITVFQHFTLLLKLLHSFICSEIYIFGTRRYYEIQ